MDAISSVATTTTTMPPMVAGGATATMGSTGAATGAAAMGSDMQMTMVQDSVSTMLASIGGESMASNDILKMAISLLILNMLAGKDKSGDSKDMMNALLTGMIAGAAAGQAGGSGTGGGMTAISMETTTASIAIGQSVSMGYVQQSYSAASVSGGGLNAVA